MSLPHPNIDFDPLTTLPAESLNKIVDNIEHLSTEKLLSPRIDLSSLHAYKKITTPKTAVVVGSAYADLTDYNISKTVVAGQTLLIEFHIPQIISTTDAVRHDFAIVEDNTLTVQTQYERIWTQNNGGNMVTLKALVTPTAGSHTWKVRIVTAGNVTITAYANATAGPNFATGICSASVVGN